jgi:hypothetical protein
LDGVIALISLVGIVAWISYGASSNCGLITLGVSIILVVAVVATYGYYGWYEAVVLISMLIIVLILALNNYIKESLLIIVISGMVLGFAPQH